MVDPILPDLVAALRTSAASPIVFADEAYPGWLSKTIAQGVELLGADDAGDSLRSARARALVALDGISGDLEELGREGVASLLRRIYSDDAKGALDAWKYYLDEGRSYEERRALQKQATRAALEEHRRRAAAWDGFVETVREVGAAALKAAIPAILAGL